MALCIDGKSRSSESCRETFFDFFNPEFHHQKGSPKKLLRCGILFDSLYQLCIPPWDSVSFKYIYIWHIWLLHSSMTLQAMLCDVVQVHWAILNQTMFGNMINEYPPVQTEINNLRRSSSSMYLRLASNFRKFHTSSKSWTNPWKKLSIHPKNKSKICAVSQDWQGTSTRIYVR